MIDRWKRRNYSSSLISSQAFVRAFSGWSGASELNTQFFDIFQHYKHLQTAPLALPSFLSHRSSHHQCWHFKRRAGLPLENGQSHFVLNPAIETLLQSSDIIYHWYWVCPGKSVSVCVFEYVDLPVGYRSMTGRSSTCKVALPPLRVNRTMWYFPSFTNFEVSSIFMSSVPTLNTTLIFPFSCAEQTNKTKKRVEAVLHCAALFLYKQVTCATFYSNL